LNDPLPCSPKPVADLANRNGSPKPRFAMIRAKAVPSWKVTIFEGLRCFGQAAPGRQKGLVDHVCPAVFS
jgi:hypothetical protein